MNPVITKQHRDSVAPLVEEAERILAKAIDHFELTVKPSQIVVTIQSRGRKRRTIGWFANDRWEKNSDRIHEINLCAECLQTHDMGEVILHELAHAENHHLNIRDCPSGQYHNKKFKRMAERLGLQQQGERHRIYGYGLTKLAAPGVAFLNKFTFKRELFELSRLSPVRRKKVGSRLVKCVCENCGYAIRTTRQWIDRGLPTCCCGRLFRAQLQINNPVE